MTPPTPQDAARVALDVLGEPAASVERFTTGAGNWVYDVTLHAGTRAVVRFVRDPDDCAAGVYWSNRLRPCGVPLPRLLAHQVARGDGERSWMVLERLPGRDFEHVYTRLTPAQRLAILGKVLDAQRIVQALPIGRGFGFVRWPDESPHASWRAVIEEGLQTSRRRIAAVGAVDLCHVDRVEKLLPMFDGYFSGIRPIPFLDDTTTRNVIIDDGGRFSGIVDVDGICYGDPLLVPALTRMALIKHGDTAYTDAWLARVHATAEQRRAVEFYTAFFCVNFLAEQGQQFNRDAPPAVNPAEVRRLVATLDALLAGLI